MLRFAPRESVDRDSRPHSSDAPSSGFPSAFIGVHRRLFIMLFMAKTKTKHFPMAYRVSVWRNAMRGSAFKIFEWPPMNADKKFW